MKQQIIPTLAALFILFAFAWYLDTYQHENIMWTIEAGMYLLVITLALALGGSSVLFVMLFRERFLTQQAERKVAQREADVHAIVSDAHGVFVREMNPKATWRPLHLNPATYQNGKEAEIAPFYVDRWKEWNALRSPRAAAAAQVIPGQAALLPVPVDLLTTLDSVQRCLIVGASDSGKTTLLQHICGRRLINSKVVVIDPHAFPGKWPGCMVIGIERNYKDIEKALVALVQLMTKRYGDIGKGTVAEMGHSRICIVIDEWRAIAYNVRGGSEAIKTLLTESRKAAFSVFVGCHSERVKALGLEGEGDLRDGFVMVRLSVVNGMRQATIDRGDGQQPATLPGPFVGQVSRISSADDFSLEVEPGEEEAQVLALFDSGKSISAIAEKVLGGKGGNQGVKIKAILERFGRV